MTLLTLSRPRRFLAVALAFELGLGIVSWLAGWALGLWPLAGGPWLSLSRDEWIAACGRAGLAIGWGLAAAVPLLLGLLVMERLRIPPVQRLRRFVHQQLVPRFDGLTVADFALLSLAAGWGEELLFRGLIQSGLERWLGGPAGAAVGLVVASAAFGLCHWLTRTYALLAALVGVYLGVVLLGTGHLLAPITAHAAYDFVALVCLVRVVRGGERRRE